MGMLSFPKVVASFVALLAFISMPAGAVTYFDATLSGSQEVPPNASAATGFGTVELNNAMDTITVDLSFSGLSSNAVVAHIHGAAGPGVNASVLFPFAGFPNTTSGSISGASFAITPAQVSNLQSGLMYFNIHTATHPGGEIRGQILARSSAIPEPGSLALLLTSLPAGIGFMWRRRRRTAD